MAKEQPNMREPVEDKIQHQRELELEWIERGKRDYHERLRRERQEAYLPPGLRLFNMYLTNVRTEIDTFCRNNHRSYKEVIQFLSHFHKRPTEADPFVVRKEVAEITLATCINSFAKNKKPSKPSALAHAIGKQLHERRLYEELINVANRKYKRDAEADPSKAFNRTIYIEQELAKLREYWMKARFIKKELGKLASLEIGGVKLPPRDKLLEAKLGHRLIVIFAESTNLIKQNTRQEDGDDHYTPYIEPTQELVEWLEKKHEHFAELNTTLPPMIVPPKPWTENGDGGYYLINSPTTWLVRHKNPRGTQIGRDEFITATHDREVYDSINAVQKTAWRINRRVYEVMLKLWEGGGGEEWKLPRSKDALEPLCPKCEKPVEKSTKRKKRSRKRNGKSPMVKHRCFSRSKKVENQWKHLKAQWHEANDENKPKAILVAETMEIAKKYVDEAEKGYSDIYFPHTFDFRGRMYPLSLFLNPQAADHGRSLLEFAEGKPVKSKEAIKWLKVHGANCYGKDKLSLADRVAWVDDNEDMIKRIAENPYKNTEWLKADDKETWRFLAFCFDYAAWLADPENHLSHLPVSVDGKCNGLQHYSAMLRDKDGGKAVALTKSTENETPVDIYQEVAKRVNKRVETEAAEGNEVAKLWLNDKGEGKVDRSITKKPVMTSPYGASPEKTRRVIRKTLQKIEKEHKERTGEDFIKPVGKLTRGDAIKYMRDVVIEVTGDTVKSAKTIMDWLKAVATVPTLFDYPGWVSPIGFHVSHAYYEQENKKIKTTSVKGVESQISSRRKTRELKHTDMTKGLPPNFVHSLDASHLMMTVLQCKEAGIKSFGMVHDSYATHAADMPAMSRLLREAFVELYSEQDVLADFRDQIKWSLDPDYLAYDTGEEGEVTIPWGDGTVATLREPVMKQIDPEEYLSEIESKLHRLVKGDLDLDEIIDSVYFFS